MGYEIGPRLRKYREAQQLSQKDFAKLIGVSNSRVSNWEQGMNRPDVDILATICEVLKISPSELLDINTPENDSEFMLFSSQEKDLVSKYKSLSLSDRKIIDEIVDALFTKQSLTKDNEKE